MNDFVSNTLINERSRMTLQITCQSRLRYIHLETISKNFMSASTCAHVSSKSKSKGIQTDNTKRVCDRGKWDREREGVTWILLSIWRLLFIVWKIWGPVWTINFCVLLPAQPFDRITIVRIENWNFVLWFCFNWIYVSTISACQWRKYGFCFWLCSPYTHQQWKMIPPYIQVEYLGMKNIFLILETEMNCSLEWYCVSVLCVCLVIGSIYGFMSFIKSQLY